MKSLGQQLREARQTRGWTIKAAAKTTKIKENMLQRLEADDFSKFAAPTYVRGFVRIYAQTLGLPVRETMQELDRILELEGEDVFVSASSVHYVPQEAPQRREITPRMIFLGLAVVIFLGLATILALNIYRVASSVIAQSAQSDTASDPAPAVKTPDPNADHIPVKKAEPVVTETEMPKAVPAAPAEAAPGPSKLVLLAHEDCWVRVSVLDGKEPREVFADIISAGQQKEFNAVKFQLKVAIPAAVDINLNGQNYGPYSADRLPVEFALPAEPAAAPSNP